ncbi:uncharacterized protein M6B38_371885 [Iris pallida]|uniref:Bifunctional inhibitor/plant lipid transfer protein/seed storage helical domain-containing protein n=1 Tax=Iris pallida TaxID=29817 RepID=A0AAX6GCI4_IRIPA|nr:uncharacterized protein M6B38_371885 [Iris pallida]
MAMGYFSFLLILAIVSLSPQALATCPCTSPSHGHKTHPPKTGPILPPIIGKPPISLPPVPVVGPIIGKPPVSLPPVPVVGPIIGKPPVTLPPVPVVGPIIGKPPVTLPPVPIVGPVIGPIIGKPPVTLPPVPVVGPVIGTPPTKKNPGCPTPPAPAKKCPADTVKLGLCLNVLGAIGGHIGDPAVECCPLIEGLDSTGAALCLCTVIKLKMLGINVFLPIAVELLIACGKTPPPGYNCA